MKDDPRDPTNLPTVKASCPKCKVHMKGFTRFGKTLAICYICGRIKEIKPA